MNENLPKTMTEKREAVLKIVKTAIEGAEVAAYTVAKPGIEADPEYVVSEIYKILEV
jgi:Fe2+ or Zn2+ uptake regulation protein